MILAKRWVAYGLLSASLAAAVLLKGGVNPRQWAWSALAISVATILAALPASDSAPRDRWGLAAMGLLLTWMIVQLVPLPPHWIARLSPGHWRAVEAARVATGLDPQAWVALSFAPSATIERLLDVLPAAAAFVAAREMAWWWRHRSWIVVAPIVGVALFESLLGIAQFYFMGMTGGEIGSAVGTYVNRNHFAGLLEMAFPVAVALAISAWRKSGDRFNQRSGPVLRIAGLAAISACLLTGIVLSQSRMGFISTSAAVALTTLIVLMSRSKQDEAHGWWRICRWLLPVAVMLSMLILLPTRELVLRFADMTSNEEISKIDRVEMWRGSLQLIRDDRWTGCGLGAFEHGFFRYKNMAPVNTVDFAHNDYLQILAELGIPGGLLVGIVAGWIASRVLAVVLRKRDAINWELAVGLLASLTAIGFHGLADFNLYIPANALVLAWLSGVGVSLGLRRIQRT